MHSSLRWKKQTLLNGLRILTYPKPSALTAQLAVAVEYGANDDANEQAGGAHFLEHLVPGGSLERIDRSREFERLGGSANFFTNPEYTLSVIDVMPNKIPKASNALSSLLFNEFFDEEQFRVEKKIILHELAEVDDDPRQKITEMLMQCLYKRHPIRRPTGGYRKTVRHLSLSELTQIHNQRYVPQNMILILSGNFSEADLAKATCCFGCLSGRKIENRKLREPETGPLRKTILKKKAGLSQTYVSLGARTVPSNHADVAALDLLNVILGVGASSRLFIELREKRALAYSIGSSQTDGLDFGYFSVDCALKKNQTKEATTLILKELANLRNKEVPDSELSKGKDMILGDIFRGMDDAEICPEILAVMEMRFGKEESLIDYTNRIKNVTTADIVDVANKYLTEEKTATAILTPTS